MSFIVTFGEIMGRLSPPGFLRFSQTVPGALEITFGGAEANVASSISLLGGKSRFVTALPDNDLSRACITSLKGLGVDTNSIRIMKKGRLGLYFVEAGANQRPSKVIYDRENSSVALTPADAYDWDAIFSNAEWFHISGITPAISKIAAEAALAAVQKAKHKNLTVSCDLNFRKKLWLWDSQFSPRELAQKTMRQILPFVDLVIANEEDASDVLDIRPADTDVEAGKISVEVYPDVARRIVEQFPSVQRVAITLRQSISASHNNWGAMLYDASRKEAWFAPLQNGRYAPYEIKNIVDRVGGGDSFAAGLICALTDKELSDPPKALSFAVASSCLAHSISGDVNYTSRSEAEALMKGSGSGRVQR